jgi:hypothetical protein
MAKKQEKAPVRITIGYGFWVDDWSEPYVKRIEKSRREYIDISDIGTGRMSKNMAENFVIYLKSLIVSGGISVAGHKESYKGGRIGYATGEMYNSIEAFRTNLSGEKKHKGWLVGIKEKVASSREYPLWYRLSFLEYGTIHQEERPIVARAFEMFVGSGKIKEHVEKMLARGLGKTAERRATGGY